MNTPRTGLAVLIVLALTALAAPAHATWSIVVCDTRTKEVGIGCATCLTGYDLKMEVPMMLVGVGGACAQSSLDSSAVNRQRIHDQMLLGTSPPDIYAYLAGVDNLHQTRQYGIAYTDGRRGAFTGTEAGRWRGARVGKVGDLAFSIQGNVLAGALVAVQARRALLTARGDLADKLMAAMEAAAHAGGDGRCSCDGRFPTSCGAPPPDFEKSAHIGFMVLARVGDQDGACNGPLGCANGDYYMSLNVAFAHLGNRDPVILLREQFTDWRASWRGRPDHQRSAWEFQPPLLPADGESTTTLRLRMVDWHGDDVGHGGARVTVQHAPGSAGLSSIGMVRDHGDGTYSVPIAAGLAPTADIHTDRFEVVVDDGSGEITLFPYPEVKLKPPFSANRHELSAAGGGTVRFDLLGPVSTGGRRFLVLASATGTQPGLATTAAHIPLNPDALFWTSLLRSAGTAFEGTAGMLTPAGHGTAWFEAAPGLLATLEGRQLDFAFVTLDPIDFASNPVSVTVSP